MRTEIYDLLPDELENVCLLNDINARVTIFAQWRSDFNMGTAILIGMWWIIIVLGISIRISRLIGSFVSLHGTVNLKHTDSINLSKPTEGNVREVH